MPKSDQEWLEAANQVDNNIRNFVENRRHRFSLYDPRLVESYLAAHLGSVLILHYREREFCAFLERYFEKLGSERRNSIFLPSSEACRCDRDTGNEQTIINILKPHLQQGNRLLVQKVTDDITDENLLLTKDELKNLFDKAEKKEQDRADEATAGLMGQNDE